MRIMSTPMIVSTPVKPLCPIFGSCGGCQYQDISYEEELSRKEGTLKELLKKEFSFSEDIFESITPSPEAVDKLPENYKVANLVVRVGEDGRVFWGGIGRHSLRMREENYFWVTVKGRKIFYALNTFFQANLSILGKIVSRIESLIAWKEDTVFLDLYSGVGLFGIALADRAREVVMIEEGGDSVELARFNVQYHQMKNVTMTVGKVEAELPGILEALGDKPCVALIDPPRGGLASSAIETLGEAKSLDSLFYLSCSPESLARDLKHLSKVG
jgi:tRNA/tmRNA/rRNA uracil-C5-methylase (TrmA/RlmC/RlmD family)